MSARCAGTNGHWHGMQRKQKPAPHEVRPHASNLSLASSGRGWHPAVSPLPAACPSWQRPGRSGFGKNPCESCHPATPQCADQGGRGTLYLQPCRKKCPTLLQSFLPGEVMLCWGFCTIQILLQKVAGIMVAMFIPLADAIWQ